MHLLQIRRYVKQATSGLFTLSDKDRQLLKDESMQRRNRNAQQTPKERLV